MAQTQTTTTKGDVISKYQVHDKDTGSPAVQIAILTDRINKLIAHLQQHKQDKSSRRGLLKLVGQRRKWLTYMERTEPQNVDKLKKELGL